jgi:thiamine pyrophosphate-dependent acetolactate synthase large subunit-like protein
LSPDGPSELDPEEIAGAAFLLRFSARPLVLAGRGAVSSGATEELVRLAESVGAPVVTTSGGQDAFPKDHPLWSGARFGTSEAASLLAESDMVIAVGTSFASAERNKPELPAQMIQVDRDPAQINRVYPARNGIVGDAKSALQRIIEEFGSAPPLQALADARASQAPERAARARKAAGKSG